MMVFGEESHGPDMLGGLVLNSAFIESFANGVSQYQVILGSMVVYSAALGVLTCAAQDSAQPRYIARTFDAPIRATVYTCDFIIDASNTDDAPDLGWGTANNFLVFFTPRREAAIDAARRARFFVQGGAVTYLGAAGLPVGTWMRATIIIRQGAGQTVCRVTNRDTGALIVQTALVAAVSPQTINQILFYTDSTLPGTFTCPVRYANATAY
jgi:hypothetical protein